MHLKKIKLAGFKSFVDPTTIPITSSMTGIVGPNGCGKSNVIDAIRWVMGESSAKHLRGDSMADVIFSGSNSRKPVGKASVELIFDNTDGKAPGQYASYAEIAIRREATRDGTSTYFLNKTKCRRKDITDIFLGTGLGPRTYSIIEQGMVTRIIESKPEDLRGFLEEAAGISRYKERRRETENRIRHTRENLDRVNDIRSELEKQLARLKRQASNAARYKELKKEERLLHAQLLALRWKNQEARLQETDSVLATKQVELEKLIAAQREIEAAIESIRAEQVEANEALNKVQEEFYTLGGEISNVEQAIQYARDTRSQQVREHEQVNHSWEEATQHLASDMETIETLSRLLEEKEPEVTRAIELRESAVEDQREAEQNMQTWQSEWETFSEASAEPEKVREIQRARIVQLESHLTQLNERSRKLAEEAETIARQLTDSDLQHMRQTAKQADQDLEQQAQALEALESRIRNNKAAREQVTDELEEKRGERQSLAGRLASLQELQDAAQGKHDSAVQDWLASQGLGDAPRLSGRIDVESGWERAVERVMGMHLNAVCVDDLNRFGNAIGEIQQSDLMLLDTNGAAAGSTGNGRRLSQMVRSDVPVDSFLSSVHVCESVAEAMAMRDQLATGESAITRDGVWVGKNWISLASEDSARNGILRREQEIQLLEEKLATLDQSIGNLQTQASAMRDELESLEAERDESRRALNDTNRERAGVFEQLGHKEARLEQLQSRRSQVGNELTEVKAQLQHDEQEMASARALLSEAEGERGEHDQRRQELQAKRIQLQDRLELTRTNAAAARENAHELEIERQRMRTTVDSTQQSVARLKGQLQHLEQRREELASKLSQGDQPEIELKAKLEQYLQKRLEVEQRLNAARDVAGGLGGRLREQEQNRSIQEKRVQQQREDMETDRVRRQEIMVRRDTLVEQAQETGHELPQVVEELPADASESQWQEQLGSVETKISRLGAINLVAIEEFEEESERKQYLDKQHEDLTKAMETLEEAMRKIDRETRTRFKETFDRVNTGVQEFFPKLFGGGHAYLELTDEDLLTAGVAVMARPPGKRNSTIHLLSGGEKALTAVAMIFSIFQLNPAPFCLLDEVDAPLDDANVERYSQTLESLSEHTQLIYITHNKISMEKADVLIGVTMSEPGVSRLVAVDVDEAMEMVANQ
ncbi:MAG: chromosome segregation protein SMC [Acidiferrobacterales bacterium]|jgi:chromosome segregation protein|nr:chromosome segregation protein SMC [Acidiferrobacterales bacterium]